MKRILFASLCALLISISVVPAQNSADRVGFDDTLTLLVRVRSRHIDYFEACVPIRVNEPFTIGQCRTETAPKLKIDEPLEWSNVASLLFKHIDTYRFVLSKKACDVGDAAKK